MTIFIQNEIDSLRCFIEEMVKGCKDAVFMEIDHCNQFMEQYGDKIGPETHVITMNNYGVDLHDMGGNNIWVKKGVKIHDIQADHPIWYRDIFDLHLPNIQFISIDRYHDAFIHQYYPEYQDAVFLPLAGKKAKEQQIAWKDRPIEILVIASIFGNHDKMEDTATQQFLEEQEIFMRNNPMVTPDMIVNEMKRDLSLNEEQAKDFLRVLYSYSLRWTRNYWRKETVAYLAQAGFHIDLYGRGWEELENQYPENVKAHGVITATECNELIYQSKFTLNFMPWFKAGAHDRIYDAMLSGSICLTDTSEYLAEHWTDLEDIVFYDYLDLSQLVSKIKLLEQYPDIAERITEQAKKKVANSTWEDRVQSILEQRFEEGSFL